jgi:hypothetical protein
MCEVVRKAKLYALSGNTQSRRVILYTFKNCEKLGVVICNTVLPFRINSLGVSCTVGQHTLYYLDHLDKIAVADGFKDWREMVQWFSKTHGLPFEGELITWKQ